jgi:hypothetical protein
MPPHGQAASTTLAELQAAVAARAELEQVTLVFDDLEPLYQRIAAAMTCKIPEAWSSARYDAIFFPDSSIYEAEYAKLFDSVSRSFEPTIDGDHDAGVTRWPSEARVRPAMDRRLSV